MRQEISGIPSEIYGAPSESVFIYVHGMGGRKEEAEEFSRTAEAKGFQVLSIDLPGHGERDRKISPSPFNVLPELEEVHKFARARWKRISLYAVSIGAWFSLVYFRKNPPSNALLVSPVVNMKTLIERMMKSAGVTPEILRDKKIIPEANLSWDYYSFACENEINNWDCRTKILYPENDEITPRLEIEEFSEKFKCDLRIVPNAGHWLHTEAELKFLRTWEEESI
ncbi:MAG: alpha/beta hydrolase [Synergistaceae bacterium]|nr:alpha/beta hydrolase [Synergistaceae bacterium]